MNTRTSEGKLTFNTTYYPTFQNVRSALEELQILLAPDKEHKKVFPEVPIPKVTLFEKYETHKQLKERETFWQNKLKTFYPLGLNEREEYLNHTQYIRL